MFGVFKSKMRYINIGQIIFVLILVMACKPEVEHLDLRTGNVFFNDTTNILWRHKVNSIESLQKYSQVFKGVELDIVYYRERNEFEVEHDPGSKLDTKLINYFAAIPNPENYYYWLDIKNLKYEYIDELLERLLFVLNKYGIKENVICESWSLKSLKTLNKAGLYTSYWIPDFPYDGEITEDQQKKLDKIKDVLDDCQHNAISAPYQMLPFIKDHLYDCSVHLWTNGLKTEKDKEKIRQIVNTDCVKVVLVDYEEPF